eukprot:4806766-Pyramimonas_sp.AAC.1
MAKQGSPIRNITIPLAKQGSPIKNKVSSARVSSTPFFVWRNCGAACFTDAGTLQSGEHSRDKRLPIRVSSPRTASSFKGPKGYPGQNQLKKERILGK